MQPPPTLIGVLALLVVLGPGCAADPKADARADSRRPDRAAAVEHEQPDGPAQVGDGNLRDSSAGDRPAAKELRPLDRPPSKDLKPAADKLPSKDTKPAPDIKPAPDKKPWPDTKPWPDQRPPDQSYAGPFPRGTGVHSGVTLSVGGVSRTLWTYVPAGLTAGRPLLIAFHGTDSTGWDALSSSGAMTLADSQKLIVVSPQARTMSSGDWDNHSAGQKYFETYPNVSPTSNNDLLLVQAIILEAQKAHGSDPKKVYTLGFSNGAFFSSFAAMTMPDKIAAFAEASGGLVKCATTRGATGCEFLSSQATTCAGLALQPGWCSCTGAEKPASIPTTGRKPPGYLTHANDDNTVSVYYTCSLASRMQALGFATSVTIRSGGGHVWPSNFATTAWPFLSQYALP